MLTQEEIAYGQQKNREHIWNQCKIEFYELNGENPCSYKDEDQACLSSRYEYLCKKSNITPY